MSSGDTLLLPTQALVSSVAAHISSLCFANSSCIVFPPYCHYKEAKIPCQPLASRTITAGLEVKRQGDWFFIPLSGEPKQEEPQRNLVTSWGEVPWTNPRLQRRVCYSEVDLVYGVRTRHRGELVVYNSFVGLPYLAPIVKGRVYAPDHDDLYLESWHIGVRNKTSTGGRRENARGQDD